MNNFTPALNLPTRKQKGLIKMFGGLAIPFYFTTSVVREGQPMKFTAVAENIEPCATTEGASAVGLSMQETYDESALGQLKGYHFVNDTRQRLDGNPIGLLSGYGYALTTNYNGTPTWNQQACVGTSGFLVTGGASNSQLPVRFEGVSPAALLPNQLSDKTYIRIRYNFAIA